MTLVGHVQWKSCLSVIVLTFYLSLYLLYLESYNYLLFSLFHLDRLVTCLWHMYLKQTERPHYPFMFGIRHYIESFINNGIHFTKINKQTITFEGSWHNMVTLYWRRVWHCSTGLRLAGTRLSGNQCSYLRDLFISLIFLAVCKYIIDICVHVKHLFVLENFWHETL